MSDILVGIILGSASDAPLLEPCRQVLDRLGIGHESLVASAHRTPDKVAAYARDARARGLKVLIAMAGLSAALPGALAAHCTLPVIGVPVAAGPLSGLDALLAMAQMPRGVPVATVAIGAGGAANAALLAAAILSLSDDSLARKLEIYREEWSQS
jgi:phosphoribosylaminoimidazole carboxylase PurE protein